MKPTDGPRLGARLAGAEVIYDWAGGLLWVLAAEEFDLRGAMAGIAGHATLVRASDGGEGALGGVPARAGAGGGAVGGAAGASSIRRGVLNPGRMAARAVVAA